MSTKALLLFCLCVANLAASDLRVIGNGSTTRVVDVSRIIAIEPYVVYVNPHLEPTSPFYIVTEDRQWAATHDYVARPRGTRILLDRQQSTVQVATAGAGLISGGDATNNAPRCEVIIEGVTPDRVAKQLGIAGQSAEAKR